MPRAGWVKPTSDRRLSDLISVGLLTKVFPPELVDEVIAATERTEQRKRSLPARVVAYFAIWSSPTKPDSRHAASLLTRDSSNSIGDIYEMEL